MKLERMLSVMESGVVRMSRLFSFLVVLAAMQVCFEVVLRYAFNAPTSWGLELSTYLCGATYILSGGYASIFDAHIRVDLFYNRFSQRTRAIVDLVFCYPLLLFMIAVLAWKSALWTLEALANGTTSGTIWDPPVWPVRLALLVGVCLLLTGEVVNLCGRIKVLKHPRKGK